MRSGRSSGALGSEGYVTGQAEKVIIRCMYNKLCLWRVILCVYVYSNSNSYQITLMLYSKHGLGQLIAELEVDVWRE